MHAKTTAYFHYLWPLRTLSLKGNINIYLSIYTHMYLFLYKCTTNIIQHIKPNSLVIKNLLRQWAVQRRLVVPHRLVSPTCSKSVIDHTNISINIHIYLYIYIIYVYMHLHPVYFTQSAIIITFKIFFKNKTIVYIYLEIILSKALSPF